MLSQFYTSGFAPSLRLTVNKRWLKNWYGAAVTAHITFCAFAPSKIFQKTSENKGWVVGNFIQVSIVGLVVRMILPIWSDPQGKVSVFWSEIKIAVVLVNTSCLSAEDIMKPCFVCLVTQLQQTHLCMLPINLIRFWLRALGSTLVWTARSFMSMKSLRISSVSPVQ